MAQTGYTPIQLYYSTTTSNVPSAGNLASGELAINITDGKLFYKDNGGVVRVIAQTSSVTNVASISFGTTGLTPSTATTGAVTVAGTLATTNGGTGLTSFTANRVFYASSTSAIGQSANLTFDGTTLTAANFTDSSLTSGRVTYATTGGNLTDSANLTFDGTNLTLGGGTANGVAYLNGSKVLTTGSALTFDGTTVTSTGGSLYLNGTNSDTAMTGSYVRFGTNIGLQSNAANSALVAKMFNGSTFVDALTLNTSGNLGLGVTPSAWNSQVTALQVKNGASFYGYSNGTNGDAGMATNQFVNAAGNRVYLANGFAAFYDQKGDTGAHRWFTAASGTAGNAISFTQAMTLTAQGNELFVGTTSGFSSTTNRGNISVNGSSDSIVALGSNGTRRGYLYANPTQMNVGSDGILVFETGGIERARITSAGNLVIGQTTATSRLTVNSNMDITDGTINVRVSQSGGSALIGTTTNHPFFFMTNDTERARITSGGNFGIGTSSPADRLTVENLSTAVDISVIGPSSSQAGIRFGYTGATYQGRVLYDNASNYMAFITNSTERARITSGGNLLVGTTSDFSSARVVTSGGGIGILNRGLLRSSVDGVLQVSADPNNAYGSSYIGFDVDGSEFARITSGGDLLVGTTSATAIGTGYRNINVSGTNGSGVVFKNNAETSFGYAYNDSVNNRFYITQNTAGVYLANGGTSWTSASDERVKDIIEPISDAAAKVSTLRAVIGKYKTDPQEKRRSFLIAQDVQAVLPEAVDATNPDELGLQYADMIPLLVAAIKEQQAIITDLRARVAQLEAK